MTGLREWLEEQVALDAKQAFTARQREEAAFKRSILQFHEAWPVLVEWAGPEVSGLDAFDPQKLTLHVSRRMAWLTEQEYIKRFGTEPPTTPMLRAMALIYRNRPGFQEEWL